MGDAQKIRLELLALADIHREDPVRQASFFEENGDLVAVRCSPIIEVDDGPATFDDFSGLIEEFRFARDSPLEEAGFEPSVPLAKEPRFSASHHAEFVDDHPSAFQIAEHAHRPRENHVSSRDRDFRPTRRRGLDDDNFETPRRSFGSTLGSSAQRFEAPFGPPVQAVVKWYNSDKGFGFVQLADGSGDAFLHVSVVERSGHGSVPPGATLEVRAGPGPKGPQVSEILSVDSSTAQQEPPRRARPERPMYPPADRAAVEESGTVKWYNAIKGFGFIASDRGGKDIFVHASALERAGITGLTEGQRVAVDVIDGRKGPEAAGLRLI